MNILVAVDSFKGCMTSSEAGTAAASGIKKVLPEAMVKVKPLADGGEGTADTIGSCRNGLKKTVRVHGPSGKKISAAYYICDFSESELSSLSSLTLKERNLSSSTLTEESDSDQVKTQAQEESSYKIRTAVIDTASAAGLELLSEEERNPMFTGTYGLGEIIKDALDSEVRSFIIGLGGSGSNDGGTGMLTALGIQFLDKSGNLISQGSSGLNDIASVNLSEADPRFTSSKFILLSDVDNPLCGVNGASLVYGPQKFAELFHSALSEEDFRNILIKMDMSMRHYSSQVKVLTGHDFSETPGAGAAGGLGFAFLSFTDSSIISGAEAVIKLSGTDEEIKKCDLVITGEGSFDDQTLHGKAPQIVAKHAASAHIPAVAVAGQISDNASEDFTSACRKAGFSGVFSIQKGPVLKENALDKEAAENNLSRTAGEICSLFNFSSSKSLFNKRLSNGDTNQEKNSFRKMRRFKQQVSKEKCIEILENEPRGVLALYGDDGYPYAVPLDFIYLDGAIYFHGAASGKKADSLKENPKVSFCVMDKGFRKPGEWPLNITSVILFGKISEITDHDEKFTILKKLGMKYYPDEAEVDDEIKKAGKAASILRLDIVHMTGKLVNES